jgi:trk system potassium uptake protein TrkH
LVALATAMLLPMAVDGLRGDPDWRAFFAAAAITGGVGGAVVLGYRLPRAPVLSPREGFLLTTLAWLVLCAFATLPLMFSERHLSFTDAYFEAMSGLTTSGGTVITNLGDMPKGLLLWRAMLQWIGGIGIIVMAVAILPVLRVGGMQLFRMESSDKSEKVRPRVSQVAGVLISVYVTLTALNAVALVIAGMGPFDAVAHAMTALSTGGFSTQDASVGYYQSPAIEWILSLFMFLGGCTFVLLARAAQGDLRALWRDTQMRWYFVYVAGFIVVIALWQILINGRPVMDAVRSTTFNIVSLATTTFRRRIIRWGSLRSPPSWRSAINDCTGSTGAIKVFRFACWAASRSGRSAISCTRTACSRRPTTASRSRGGALRAQLLRLLYPVLQPLSIAVSAFGLDLVTSLRGVAQALGNVGPGLGPIIGPTGTYAPLPDGAIWVLSIAMLLGRLELLTVLVLFSPVYWRG